MDTLKELLIDVLLAVTVFTLTAGSCNRPKACTDVRQRVEAPAKS